MTIFQQRKQHAYWFGTNAPSFAGNTPPCPLHHNMQRCIAPFVKKALHGKDPVDSSFLLRAPHSLLRMCLLHTEWSVSWPHSRDAQEHSSACFLPYDFCSACFPCVLIAKQREIIGWFKIHSLGDGDSCSLPPWLSLQEKRVLCVAWLKGQWEESKVMIC